MWEPFCVFRLEREGRTRYSLRRHEEESERIIAARAGLQALAALMREDAARGGGVSTRSDGNHARELGVHRATIRRWKCKLADQGVIVRDGYHHWGPMKKTVRWRVRCDATQEVKINTTNTSLASGRKRCGYTNDGRVRRARAAQGRRRRIMEQHPAVREDGIVRKDGSVTPANAGDVIAAVVDIYRAEGIPLSSRFKGIIAREAKTLLEDGFDWKTVVAACVLALRRSEPHRVAWIASDLALGTKRLTREEYEYALRSEAELARWREIREERDRKELEA